MIGTGLEDECGSSGAYGFWRHTKMQQIASHTRGGPANTAAREGPGSSKLHVHLGREEGGRCRGVRGSFEEEMNKQTLKGRPEAGILSTKNRILKGMKQQVHRDHCGLRGVTGVGHRENRAEEAYRKAGPRRGLCALETGLCPRSPGSCVNRAVMWPGLVLDGRVCPQQGRQI